MVDGVEWCAGLGWHSARWESEAVVKGLEEGCCVLQGLVKRCGEEGQHTEGRKDQPRYEKPVESTLSAMAEDWAVVHIRLFSLQVHSDSSDAEQGPDMSPSFMPAGFVIRRYYLSSEGLSTRLQA